MLFTKSSGALLLALACRQILGYASCGSLREKLCQPADNQGQVTRTLLTEIMICCIHIRGL